MSPGDIQLISAGGGPWKFAGAANSASRNVKCVNRMLDEARQAAPRGAEGRLGGGDVGDVASRPRSAGQFHRRAQQPLRRPSARQKCAIRASRIKSSADARRLFFFGRAGREVLRRIGPRGAACALERTSAAGGISRTTDRGANIHHRLGEIAGPVGRRQCARGPVYRSLVERNRRRESVEARKYARDVPVNGGRWTIEGYRGDRRRGVGTNAGQFAQDGLVARKIAPTRHDLARTGMQVARARIIAEAGESLHHVVQRCGGERLQARPARDEIVEIGRRADRCGLLQQDFGQPDAVGLRRLPGWRPPGQLSPVDVPPGENGAGYVSRLQNRAAAV